MEGLNIKPQEITKGSLVEVGRVRLLKINSISLVYSRFKPFLKGDYLVIDTPRGLLIGKAVDTSLRTSLAEGMQEVVKHIPHKDVSGLLKRHQDQEAKAAETFKELVAKSGLEMKLSQVVLTYDEHKYVFYFTAPGRVDFRQLVRDLAKSLSSKIELRQIGVRDEARALGGIGMCGRELCCVSHLEDFISVALKVTKIQGISSNPQKFSGLCGRLMCCLAYEVPVYEELAKESPVKGERVKTRQGNGVVQEVRLLKGEVVVKLEDGRLVTEKNREIKKIER